MKTLVTLGCSWTFGIGVGYDEDPAQMLAAFADIKKFPRIYTEEEYDSIKGADYPSYENFIKNRKNQDYFTNFVWEELTQEHTESNETIYNKIRADESIADLYSFRGIISKLLYLNNVNFSLGGSSNDEQFDIMSKIFGDAKKREQFIESDPVVLWGITSTARIFRNNKSIMLSANNSDVGSKNEEELYKTLYTKLYYDHEQRVSDLCNQIELWNTIFDYYNVPVIWFDTFNTHNYPRLPRNFIPGGDLLTQMLDVSKSKISKAFYHYSNWTVDDPRISEGIKLKLLNPITMHPTKAAHIAISKTLLPYIEKHK